MRAVRAVRSSQKEGRSVETAPRKRAVSAGGLARIAEESYSVRTRTLRLPEKRTSLTAPSVPMRTEL